MVPMTLILDKVVPWGRSFDEYRRMFNLAPEDLEKRILGCGDGPASFNAEMARRGKRVTSVDPLYEFSPDRIRARIHEVFHTIIGEARQKADAFVWDHIVSPEHLGEIRMEAMNTFLDDYSHGRDDGRYVTGSLPQLPFSDGAFEMALCSHYLFTYSGLIGEREHVEAILEMSRVAGLVRVFPLVDMFGGGRSRHLDGVIQRLDRMGFTANIRKVPYEFQRGGNEMLAVMQR